MTMRLVEWLRRAIGPPRIVVAANIAAGTHAGGRATKKADAAISDKYLIGKAGSDADHVNICGAADVPLCVITDEATAIEDNVACEMLGSSGDRTQLMVASAAITVFDFVVPAAAGQVRTLPALPGNYYVIGRALTAATAAAEEIEVVPAFPHLVTVS